MNNVLQILNKKKLNILYFKCIIIRIIFRDFKCTESLQKLNGKSFIIKSKRPRDLNTELLKLNVKLTTNKKEKISILMQLLCMFQTVVENTSFAFYTKSHLIIILDTLAKDI